MTPSATSMGEWHDNILNYRHRPLEEILVGLLF